MNAGFSWNEAEYHRFDVGALHVNMSFLLYFYYHSTLYQYQCSALGNFVFLTRSVDLGLVRI